MKFKLLSCTVLIHTVRIRRNNIVFVLIASMKRTISEINPFELSKRKNQRPAAADVDEYWTCFMCQRKIKNKAFFIECHVEQCLQSDTGNSTDTASMQKTSLLQSSAVMPPMIRLENRFHLMKGLWVLHDFVTEEEESQLIQQIDADPYPDWHISSFNGYTDSKVYGVRTQFGLPREERIVRKNNISNNEYDIPSYLDFVIHRFKDICIAFPELCPLLKTFKVNECNINSYVKEKNHYLTAHFDDRALSGPVLLNVSLACPAIMTYSLPEQHLQQSQKVQVHLPRRCLQIVSEDARYKYKHSITADNVLGERRVSLTFRAAGGTKGTAKGVIDTSKQVKLVL